MPHCSMFCSCRAEQAVPSQVTGVLLAMQVTVDVPWSPYDIDGRSYDFKGLAEAADLLFIMMYDTQSQVHLTVTQLTRPHAHNSLTCQPRQLCRLFYSSPGSTSWPGSLASVQAPD